MGLYAFFLLLDPSSDKYPHMRNTLHILRIRLRRVNCHELFRN